MTPLQEIPGAVGPMDATGRLLQFSGSRASNLTFSGTLTTAAQMVGEFKRIVRTHCASYDGSFRITP
jgi:hypothetical protein